MPTLLIPSWTWISVATYNFSEAQFTWIMMLMFMVLPTVVQSTSCTVIFGGPMNAKFSPLPPSPLNKFRVGDLRGFCILDFFFFF